MGIPTGWELIVLLAVLVLLFGSTKLPTAARSIGQSLRIFKAETKGMRSDRDGSESAGQQRSEQQQAQPQAVTPPQASPPQVMPPSPPQTRAPAEEPHRGGETTR